MNGAQKGIVPDRDGVLRMALENQRKSFLNDGPPDVRTRRGRIDRAIALLVDNQNAIAEGLCEDFESRSAQTSLLADVAGSIASLKFARENLRAWMRPEKRKTTPAILGLLGARARVEYRPKGVVGVISPWNFPVQLTFAPLAGIFAAGNRVLIKPSEYTPRTSELMARMFASAFDKTEVAVFPGGPEMGAAFAGLPFDHLLFTGAGSIARHVLHAAAENLTPVTLELGGKSPVIIGRSARLALAAMRVMFGKTMNAGQICLAPDYVFVPKDKRDGFVAAAASAVAAMYPALKDNPDYTSIVNRRHYERLQGYLSDAVAKGAKIVELNPSHEDFSQQPFHKIPPTLILDPSDDMAVMQDEIFGPLLPVKTYDSVDEAIAYINARPRPLGLYYFGANAAEEKSVLTRTTSGGVTLNDVVMHVSMEDLPFGGIGASGMGTYHGYDGFRSFSHAQAVYRQTWIDYAAPLRPPYGARFRKIVNGQIKK